MRSKVFSDDSEFKLIIPAQKHFGNMIFRCFWLLLCGAGGIATLTSGSMVTNKNNGIVIIWLLLWIFAGIACLATVLWSIGGK